MGKKPVQLYADEDVIGNFYAVIADRNTVALQHVHIPKSDVFYVREAIYQNTGDWYTLDHVERAMYLEGHLQANEVLDPHRKRAPYYE